MWRSAALAVVVLGTVAAARGRGRAQVSLVLAPVVPVQQTGSWRGYVRGWVDDGPRYGFYPSISPYAPGYVPLSYAPGLPYYAAPLYLAPPQPTAQQVADQQAAQLQAAQQQLALQRYDQQREEVSRAQYELAAQQRALQQAAQAQQEAAQQLAEQQRTLQQDTARRDEEQRQAERQRDERERERERIAAAQAPREKGPDVYKWVDDRGVVNYSTRPPADGRTRAKKLEADGR